MSVKDLARNNFPVSSAEGPGWQGAFEAVYTDVNKEKATLPARIDPCSKLGSYFGPDPKRLGEQRCIRTEPGAPERHLATCSPAA